MTQQIRDTCQVVGVFVTQDIITFMVNKIVSNVIILVHHVCMKDNILVHLVQKII